MKRSLIAWMLGGALAASLTWNVRAAKSPTSEHATCVSLDLAELGLDQQQALQLLRWRTSVCERSCEIDDDVSAKLAELSTALRDPSTPEPRLRALAAEVDRLRSNSLNSCVDAIVQVRSVLTQQQLTTLLDRCCPAGACK